MPQLILYLNEEENEKIKKYMEKNFIRSKHEAVKKIINNMEV